MDPCSVSVHTLVKSLRIRCTRYRKEGIGAQYSDKTLAYSSKDAHHTTRQDPHRIAPRVQPDVDLVVETGRHDPARDGARREKGIGADIGDAVVVARKDGEADDGRVRGVPLEVPGPEDEGGEEEDGGDEQGGDICLGQLSARVRQAGGR